MSHYPPSYLVLKRNLTDSCMQPRTKAPRGYSIGTFMGACRGTWRSNTRPFNRWHLGFDGQNSLQQARLTIFVVDETVLDQAVAQQKHFNESTMQINVCNDVEFQLKMAEMDCFWGHRSFFRIPAGCGRTKCVNLKVPYWLSVSNWKECRWININPRLKLWSTIVLVVMELSFHSCARCHSLSVTQGHMFSSWGYHY
jgi:hypothetical protein